MVKNPPAKAGNLRAVGSIPGREDPLEEGKVTHSYSCLEDPTDMGAWRASVHRVSKSQTRLKRLNMRQCSAQILALSGTK